MKSKRKENAACHREPPRLTGDFVRGMISGIPIALGYLSVSFAFGIRAVGSGLTAFQAALISLTNLTSAGQVAGVDVIAADGSLLEMAAVQLTINIRYALMAISLSQNLDKSFTLPHRLLAAYGITDEIFAVCSTSDEPIKPPYMYGIITVAALGWVSGTFIGGFAGEALPDSVTAALGIVIYGMFIAIIVPPSAKNKSILFVVIVAALLSILCRIFLPALSGGFSVIICAVGASVAAALVFPKKEEEEAQES